MRYPEFLKKNGTIGFVAPSFGADTEPYRACFDRAVEFFREKGFKTLSGPNVHEGCGIGISNTPEKCAAELMSFYLGKSEDPALSTRTTDRESVTDEAARDTAPKTIISNVSAGTQADVLISVGGGELMCELLPLLDFAAIKKAPPKWYMGYSDNTNFIFPLLTLCDTAAVYGPHAGAFSMEPLDASLRDAFDIITGEKLSVSGYELWEKESLKDADHPFVPYNLTEKSVISMLPASSQNLSFRGRFIGGCLDCLQVLLGTPYEDVSGFLERYKEDGFIWYLEACDLSIFAIRRALFQMREAGWFRYAKGFLIGRPLTAMDQSYLGLDRHSAVTGILKALNVPILMDVPFGHVAPSMPIISGAMGNVSFNHGKIRIDFELN